MQDEAAPSTEHYDTVQSSNGLHTSSTNPYRFLDGQQHQRWMVPSQQLFSVQQNHLPSTMAQQVQQAHRSAATDTSIGISRNPSEGVSEGSDVQVPEGETNIETGLDGRPRPSPEHSPGQVPPDKRPRLATQPQRSTLTRPNFQYAPVYSFVSSPSNQHSAHDPTMPPPVTSTTSPHIATGTGNLPENYPTTQASIPRRQSSHRNMELPRQHPAQMSRTGTRPSIPSPAARQPNTTQLMPHSMLLPRLEAAMADPFTGKILSKDWAHHRSTLLKDACRLADWFYLTLHQIYCLRTLKRDMMGALGINGVREHGLTNLESVLLPNTSLQFLALEWFALFPTDLKSLLQRSSPDASRALTQVHIMLDKVSMHWPQLQVSCIARRYPPSPYELYELGMLSTVLQGVFFTYIFRLIEGADAEGWIERAQSFFNFTQKQHIDKINRINQGRIETWPNYSVALAQFAKEYSDLRSQCFSRPAPGGNTSNVQSAVQSPAPMPGPGTSPTVLPSTSDSPAIVSQPRALDHSIPPVHALQTPAPGSISRVRTEVATNHLNRPRSESQSRPMNHTLPAMGPRQQDFIQETMGIQAVQSVAVPNLEQWSPRSTADPATLTQAPRTSRNSRNASTGNLPPGLLPMFRPARPPLPSNGLSRTLQSNHMPQQTARLLPPPGKSMTQSTQPNPNLLALHQARLTTPEPCISKVWQSQESSRLFQVFQRFVLSPQLITNQQSFYTWDIDIPEIDVFRIARDVSVEEQAGRPAAKVKREFHPGSFVYRLRCIRVTSGLDEAEWTTAPTFWPAACFVSHDNLEIEIRRKSHWGKNLPCDLTSRIKSGVNIIELSVDFLPEELPHTYAVAIELIEVFNRSQCTHKLTLIEQPKALATIVAGFTTAANDDDIVIVDPYISIDLIDPFTAQVWKIPVRGKTCTHRECFDLGAFLDSRPSKYKDVPLSSADHWKCPICNKDARPQSLVLDGFLLSVSKQLQVASDEGEEVRAIRVTADGSWKPVREERNDARNDTGTRDDPANATSARSTPSVNASKETVLGDIQEGSVIVIDLDDE